MRNLKICENCNETGENEVFIELLIKWLKAKKSE